MYRVFITVKHKCATQGTIVLGFSDCVGGITPRGFVSGRSEKPVATVKLGKDALSTRLKYYIKLVAAEYPAMDMNVNSFASHSLRRGSVSAAWQCEVGRELLKGHGRWSSDAIDLYLQAGIDNKLTVTERM